VRRVRVSRKTKKPAERKLATIAVTSESDSQRIGAFSAHHESSDKCPTVGRVAGISADDHRTVGYLTKSQTISIMYEFAVLF
jgi:hypothetical protein